MSSSSEQITPLLSQLQQGNPDAPSKLMPLVYQQLREIAARQLQHERPGHTFQPSDLVQEAYLSVVKPGNNRWRDRAHFFRVAARAMRRILIDYVRAQEADQRGGGRLQRVELSDTLAVSSEASGHDLLVLDDALTRLEELSPRQSRIVELRYFAGCSIRETAQALGLGVTTVKAEWLLAKAWLRRELESQE